MDTASNTAMVPTTAMLYLPIFGRSFLQVSLVALNVAQIARGNYWGGFAVGCAISYLWCVNARTAATGPLPYTALVYSLGAGFGTVFGMGLSRWIA